MEDYILEPITSNEIPHPSSKTMPYEIHHCIDVAPRWRFLPRRKKPPIPLNEVNEVTRALGIDVGGWFLFHNPSGVWSYRSNAFTEVDDDTFARDRHLLLRDAFRKRIGRLYQRPTIKTIVEKILGIWNVGNNPKTEK
jgi:hypothetical protein